MRPSPRETADPRVQRGTVRIERIRPRSNLHTIREALAIGVRIERVGTEKEFQPVGQAIAVGIERRIDSLVLAALAGVAAADVDETRKWSGGFNATTAPTAPAAAGDRGGE